MFGWKTAEVKFIFIPSFIVGLGLQYNPTQGDIEVLNHSTSECNLI